MEPVTHFLTGACLGRAGFNRKTAYATLAMTLAAEAPDLDVFWGIGGPIASFQHHRGITHTLVGAPFVALATTGVVFLWHRWRTSPPRKRAHAPDELAPRWPLIWLFALLAVFSHLLLDYTNNYGLRPFFPFNPRWYSWDIVFIFEPLIFLALALAMVMPAIFGLADREIGAQRSRFRGRGWAIAALVSMVVLYGVRNAEHRRALNLMRTSLPNGSGGEAALRVAAEPYPINPFHWHGLAETANSFQTASIDTRADLVDPDSSEVTYKPPVTMATLAAKRSRLGRAYLDWSSWPVVTDIGSQPAPGASEIPNLEAPLSNWHTVEFLDLRFSYSVMFLKNAGAPPLTGWVYVGPQQEIEAMIFSGREQK